MAAKKDTTTLSKKTSELKNKQANVKTVSKKTKESNIVKPQSPVEEAPKPVVVEEAPKPVVVDEAPKPSVVEEAPKPSVVEEEKSDTDSKSDKTELEKNAFITKLNLFTSKVAAINREVRELQSIGRTLERDFTQVIRVITKQKSKNKSNMENRPLSGFAMPSLLSKELYSFLNIDEGTRIPRKDVTRMLNEYIKENNLRDEKDKRRITPDAALTKIFGCKDTDVVTYFNLQTYMKHHFIKEVKHNFQPVNA